MDPVYRRGHRACMPLQASSLGRSAIEPYAGYSRLHPTAAAIIGTRQPHLIPSCCLIRGPTTLLQARIGLGGNKRASAESGRGKGSQVGRCGELAFGAFQNGPVF